jgi:hypothetical protein
VELHRRLGGPASLWVYEGEGRLMGGVTREATAAAIDWLAACLDGKAPEPVLRRVPSWRRSRAGGGINGLDVDGPDYL